MTTLAVEKIHEIIAQQAGAPIDEVRANPKLADLCLDSLDIIEMIMAIEDELAIRVNDEDVSGRQTVNDFTAVFTKQLAKEPV